MAKTTTWVAGASVLALALAAVGYFGVVSPTLGNAEAQRQAASDQTDHNDLLGVQIAKLKAEFAHLDDYKAELAAIQAKAPATADLAELTREVKAVADQAGVTLTVLTPGAATAFVAPAAPTAAPSPTATDDASATDAAAAATDDSGAATSGPAVVSGLFTIPLSMSSVGTYEQTMAFLDSLQQSLPRLYVISQVNATSLQSGGATAGRPAVNDGDLETVITGSVLTYQDSSTQPTTAEPTPTPGATAGPTLPVPGSQPNPFLPLVSP